MSNYALPTESPPLSAPVSELGPDQSHQQQVLHGQQQGLLGQQQVVHGQQQQRHVVESPDQDQHIHQSEPPQQHQHQAYPSIAQHGGLASPVSQATATAIATAHHGLQALQAATGNAGIAPGSMAVQYPGASSLASPMLDASYGSVDSGMSSHSPLMQQPQHQQQHHQQQLSPPQSQSQVQMKQKATRLRKACDLCSSRKVKCDEAGPPCRPCRELNVECTFNRVAKRRGPPNKHAEALKAAKRVRLEPNLPQPQQQQLAEQPGLQQHLQPPIQYGPEPTMSPAPPSVVQSMPQAMMPITGDRSHGAFNGKGAEAIAPEPVLVQLVDDFFTYIHPLTPFPHEPTFRASFLAREDRTNPEFLALLSSMIGCLVASFPRTARTHLKNSQSANLFPRAIIMIDRCREVALAARGSNFLAEKEINVYDAATSYFLGLAAGYTLQWKVCRRFMSETITFIRELGYHKPPDLGSSMHGVTYRGPSFDHVQDQLGKRLFWVMLLGVRSMHQLGEGIQDVIIPIPTPSEPYPAPPAEVDDQYIVQTQILGQPEGTVSLLTGFNQACRIYMTMNPLVGVDFSYGISSLPWQDQRRTLEQCLQSAKDVLKSMPHELTLDMDAPLGSSDAAFEGLADFQYHPSQYSNGQPSSDVRHHFGNQFHPSMARRRLQYEIQKANIYVSQLATRSYFVERYFSLRDIHLERIRSQTAQEAYAAVTGSAENDNDNKAGVATASIDPEDQTVDDIMTAERELIVKNLLTVLTSLPQKYMEPNGGSLINKIRQVASTLLNETPEQKGPLARHVQDYLARFLGILTRLEKTGPANGGVGAGPAENRGLMTVQDEEEELRNWADLHDHQRRFQAQGGFMMMP